MCCVTAALLAGSARGQPSNASDDALLSTAAYSERPHPSAHAAMELPGMTGTDFELLDLPPNRGQRILSLARGAPGSHLSKESASAQKELASAQQELASAQK